MKVVGFSGSPGEDGNMDVMVNAVLTGSKETGAETVSLRRFMNMSDFIILHRKEKIKCFSFSSNQYIIITEFNFSLL